MGRILGIATTALLVGFGVGYFTRGVRDVARHNAEYAADLAAIDKLNRDDIAVTLTQDPKGLVDIWSDDGVRFTPGNPPTIGKQAIAAENEKFRTQYPEFKVLKYAPDLKRLQIAIAGDWAIEVGSMEASYQLSSKESPANLQDSGMRLLKKQPDGSWKFAVVGLK